MDKNMQVFNGKKCLFATGVYIMPCLCADGKYRWVVTTFDDDTFEDGDVFNPAFVSANDVNVLENTSDEMAHPEIYGENND
jgi:hypothetical protein